MSAYLGGTVWCDGKNCNRHEKIEGMVTGGGIVWPLPRGWTAEFPENDDDRVSHLCDTCAAPKDPK